MNDDGELIGLVQEANKRRCWLLHEALRCFPLDRAVELARNAEAFVLGSPVENRLNTARVDTEVSGDAPVSTAPVIKRQISETPAIAARTSSQHGLALSPDQREQILVRLARGARNAELASEFGLSSKQVQGIRMGSAREIAKRRDGQTETAAPPPQITSYRASGEDVVRYLRQRDDVVVPNGDGSFLVNGRIQLGLAELVERANKMRRRQGKPEFPFVCDPAAQARKVTAVNGHPMFWNERAPTEL